MRERSPRDSAASMTAPLSLAAFTAMVDERQAALHAFLRGLLGDAEQARDLTQDTFHAAWRATQAGDPPWTTAHDAEERRRWLFQAAYHRAISLLRRRRVIRWTSLDRAGAGDDAMGDAAPTATLADSGARFEQRIAEAEALRAALARLAPDDAACLLLRVAQGFSAAEAAAILGVTTDAVAQRLSRARRRLRAVYLQQNPPEDADGRTPVERSDGDE